MQYAYQPAGPHYFNVARAASDGVEVEAQARVGAHWQLNASGTWLDTEVLDAGLDEGEGAVFVDGQRLLRRPTQSLSLGVVATPHPRVTARGALVRVGSRDDRDFSTFPATPVVLEAWTRVDFGLTWRVRDAVTLLLRADNALGARYAEAFGFAAPRRQFTVGAEWQGRR